MEFILMTYIFSSVKNSFRIYIEKYWKYDSFSIENEAVSTLGHDIYYLNIFINEKNACIFFYNMYVLLYKIVQNLIIQPNNCNKKYI